MPNAVCFLIAYGLVLLLELGRWAGLTPQGRTWLKKLIIAMTVLALMTHSLYLLDRLFLSAVSQNHWRLVSSWHDWGILTSWALAVAYGILLVRRSDSWIGLFVLPLLLVLIGVSLIVPKAPLGDASSATIWRLVHGVAMTIGTMLITLGFSMSIMYMIQEWRLKNKRSNRGLLRLPSLEYLESFGSTCLLASAGSIGFGVVSGVIMNLVQDGRINWTDGGIVFSAGLFVWLIVAAYVQRRLSLKGKGNATAWINVLSFLIVALVLAYITSTPHSTSNALNSRPPNLTETSGGVP